MKVEGQTQIAANRSDTFLHGCQPQPWREASEKGRLSVNPHGDEPLELGSILDISVDLSGTSMSPLFKRAIKKVVGNGPIEFEGEITTMEPNKRIVTMGGLSVAKFCLEICLDDIILPHNSFATMAQTTAYYSLDVNLSGALRPFSRALAGIEPIMQHEADTFVARLGRNIESSVYTYGQPSEVS